jgi:hypothetical protein
VLYKFDGPDFIELVKQGQKPKYSLEYEQHLEQQLLTQQEEV